MSPLVVMSVPFRQFLAAEHNVERIIGSGLHDRFSKRRSRARAGMDEPNCKFC